MKFKKSLGQNLLIDKNILKKILSLTSFKNKKIIEIGAGTGNLSFEILKNVKWASSISIRSSGGFAVLITAQ